MGPALGGQDVGDSLKGQWAREARSCQAHGVQVWDLERERLCACEGDETIMPTPRPAIIQRAYWHRSLEAAIHFYILASFDPHCSKASKTSTPFMDEETEAQAHG